MQEQAKANLEKYILWVVWGPEVYTTLFVSPIIATVTRRIRFLPCGYNATLESLARAQCLLRIPRRLRGVLRKSSGNVGRGLWRCTSPTAGWQVFFVHPGVYRFFGIELVRG